MGTLLKTDGTESEFKNPPRVSWLRDMQKAVGGFIEYVRFNDGRVMVVNEEGQIHGLQENKAATELMKSQAPKYWWGPGHCILGDVVILTREEFYSREEP